MRPGFVRLDALAARLAESLKAAMRALLCGGILAHTTRRNTPLTLAPVTEVADARTFTQNREVCRHSDGPARGICSSCPLRRWRRGALGAAHNPTCGREAHATCHDELHSEKLVQKRFDHWVEKIKELQKNESHRRRLRSPERWLHRWRLYEWFGRLDG
jgi:hypothetical protein